MNNPGQAGGQKSSLKGLGDFPHKNANEVMRELTRQSDRGVAVLGGAFLEACIRGSLKIHFKVWDLPNIKSRCKPSKMGAKLLGDDDTGGELGFVNQCRLAYCMRIIGAAAFRDCERVAQVRNKFAHHPEINSFSGNEKIVKLCSELESNQIHVDLLGFPTWDFGPSELMTPRQKFMQNVNAIFSLISARSSVLENKNKLQDVSQKPEYFW